MTDRTRSGGPAGPPWPVDVLADLHAGVLDAEQSASLWPRVNADPEARAVLEALDTVKVELGQLGHAPAEPMPAQYAARLDAALATQTRPAFAQPPQAPRMAPVVNLEEARRKRNRRMAWGAGVLTAAAAAVAVMVAVLPGQNKTPGDAQAAPLAVQSDDLGSLIGPVTNKFDYGPLESEQRLNRCLEANKIKPGSVPILGVSPIMLDSRSGVLVLLGTGQAGQFRLLVVEPTCDTGKPGVIANTVVGR